MNLLGLKILNADATLNNFQEVTSARIVRGADSKIMLRLTQPDKKHLRYIPASGATLSIGLLKSDGTVLTKTPTQPFADDRSIIQIVLTDSETATLISQNLNLELNEGTDKSFAILQYGLQVASLTSDC